MEDSLCHSYLFILFEIKNFIKWLLFLLSFLFCKLRFLQKRDPSLPQLKKKAPPSKFLEADWSDFEESDPRIPPEIFYLLRSVR